MAGTDLLHTTLDSLNDAQRLAVEHVDSPLLILAGAGSGKTRVITVKVAHLIRRHGCPARSILAVTFTNKAAGEMRRRAAELAPEAEDACIRTFHSFGAWFLRRNAAPAGLSSQFTIYDDEDSLTLLHSIYPSRKRRELGGLARAISRAKDYGLRPDDDLAFLEAPDELPEAYAAYEEKLREIGNVDFGDLILRPVELLRENEQVRERTQSRFGAILVDEYQDSNVAQYELLRLLAGPGAFVCVVGDDDQSIYRFRGAEVRNILTFHETFADTRVVRLERNYRSTAPILRVAGAVVEGNVGRLGKTLYTERGGGAKPLVAFLPDAEREVELCLDLARRGPWHETAILYRTNAQSRAFEGALMRAGIPYRIVGTVRFYEREEVKDALAFLRFIGNPRDEVSFRRIANKPSRGIGERTMERILDAAARGGMTLAEAVKAGVAGLPRRGREGLAELSRILERCMGRLNAARLSEFVDAVVRESGLEQYHREQDEYAGTQKLENLEELRNAADLYPGGPGGLTEFLEEIELDAAREQTNPGDENAVTLITMHNTKGLEFPRVIITGVEDGLFPRVPDHRDDEEAREELEEERRLFYVAVTRAENELYITTSRFRRLHGSNRFSMPSQFLAEIPADLVSVHDEWGDGVSWLGRGGTAATVHDDDGAGAGPDDSERDGADGADGHPAPGDAVYHDEYGTGVVVRQWRQGGELVVRVRFESGRQAVFLPRYTQLERVDVDE